MPRSLLLSSLMLLLALGPAGCGRSDEPRKSAGGKDAGQPPPLEPPTTKLCFYYREKPRKFFFDEGEIYAGGRLLGRTKKGCVRVGPRHCGRPKLISFYPESLKLYKYRMHAARKMDPCAGGEVVISKHAYKRFARLEWSVPYVRNIDLDDPELKRQAREIIEDCGDTSCAITEIYGHVVSTLDYIEDPPTPKGEKDLIFTPQQTLARGGGDCEDLTGVLNSYLEAVGVKTFIVLADEHAYALACGVDPPRLKKYVMRNLRERARESRTREITLPPGKAYYRGGEGPRSKRLVTYKYSLSADQPMDVYLVNSKAHYRRFVKKKRFEYYKRCSARKALAVSKRCKISSSGGIIVLNKSTATASVSLDMTVDHGIKALKPKGVDLTYYVAKGKKCVVLEPTAGAAGHPGLPPEDKSFLQIAIDPRTHELVELR